MDDNADKGLDEHFRGRLEEKGSVSAWMCRVASMLEEDSRDGFQLMYEPLTTGMNLENSAQIIFSNTFHRALAEEPGPEDLPSFFSSRQMMGNLKTIYSKPVWVLIFVVSVTWGIDLQPWAPGFIAKDAQELARPAPPMLPSLHITRNVTSETTRRIIWGSTSQTDVNLNSNCGHNEIFLAWIRSVTTFKADLNVYIWEPHTRSPSTEYAKIVLCPPNNPEETMRILISLRSCRLQAAYTDKRDACSAQEDMPALRGTQSQSWSNALLSILCVLEVLVSDTDDFLRAYHKESSRMVSIPIIYCELLVSREHSLKRLI